ncbi:excalibur calcium-binding protein [Streptomyces sp. enrichment culture]|uniref:excalibur calcium-binding protein n=1 Tax=Streptomyces sp. enrichment culture TaxID=1795815 RepID=UPI003F554B6A
MRIRNGAVGALFTLTALAVPAGSAHAQDLDCADFAFQEDAQAQFDRDRGDPHRLDEDQGADDGIACEALPRRGGATAPTGPSTALPSRGVQGGLGGTSSAGVDGGDLALGSALVTGAVASGFLLLRRRGRTGARPADTR